MLCSRTACGRKIPDDAIYCPYCGKKQAAAPVYTVQGWEQRRTCPLHVKLMMMELLGQWSPADDMGVQIYG